jgi:hypothetical protein
VRLPFNFAALLDGHIRISPGGETKKIRVLDSDPKTSLAKWPNAQLATFYTILQANFFSGADTIFSANRKMY